MANFLVLCGLSFSGSSHSDGILVREIMIGIILGCKSEPEMIGDNLSKYIGKGVGEL